MNNKKIISLILSITIIFSLCPFVSAEETKTFNDDFNTLLNWTAYGAKGFSTCSKGLIFNNMKDYINVSSLTAGQAAWKDYTVNTTVIPSNGYYGGVYFRYKDADNHYLLQFYFASKKVALLKKVNGGIYTTVSERNYTFKYGTEYSVTIDINGDDFVVSINNTNIMNVTDSAIKNGQVGFKGLRSVFYVKDISVQTKQLASASELAAEAGKLVSFELPETYKPLDNKLTTKQLFEARRKEIPDEISVVKPIPVRGDLQIYVSTNGNDKNEGTINKPLKTLTKAIDVVSKDAKLNGAVIYLREGTYGSSETVNISKLLSGTANAPVFISAYKDEKAVVTGGYSLDSKYFKDVTEPRILKQLDENVRDKVKVINLRELGIKSVPEIDGSYNGTSLYMNGETCCLARYPNLGNAIVEKVVDTGPILKSESTTAVEKDDGRGFRIGVVSDIEPLSWQNTDDIRIRGGLYYEWDQVYSKIHIDYETKSFNSLGKASPFGVKKGAEFFYYNVLEELNFPGEYYIDRKTMKLYLYPVGEIKDAPIYLSVIPMNTGMLTITDTSNLVFNNINFEASTNSAIACENTKDVVFQRCNFQNFGGNELSLHNCTRTGATCCTFSKFGNRAMYAYVDQAVAYKYQPSNNFIQNCAIHGNKDQMLNSMTSFGGVGNVMSHNYYGNGYATGIGFTGFCWEPIVEYNEIVACPKYQFDSGAMYGSGGSTGMRGSQIRYNYMHDAAGTNTLTRTVYYDGTASDNMTYGNIQYKYPAGMFSHSGRDVVFYNNISLSMNNADTWAATNSDNFYNKSGDTIFQNIMGKDPSTGWNFPKVVLDRNPPLAKLADDMIKLDKLRKTAGYERGEFEDNVRAPGNFYYAQNFSALKGGKWMMSEAGAKNSEGMETNVEYSGDEDLGFVDYEHQNFNLKDDSIIYKLIPGFEKPKFDKMGLIISDEYMQTRPYLGQFGKIVAFSPIDGESGSQFNQKVEFKWTDINWATNYKLEIATDKDFQNMVYSKDINFEYATLELPGIGQQYFWRVTAYAKGKSIDQTPLESDIFTFTTMTEDEIAKNVRINTAKLDELIDKAVEISKGIVEGSKAGQFKPGTKVTLTDAINVAKEISANPKKISDVAVAETNLKNQLNAAKSNEIYGYTYPDFSADMWDEPATDQFIKNYDKKTGVLTLNSLHGIQNVYYKKLTSYKQIFKFQMMLTKFDAWWGITPTYDVNVKERYFFIFNPQPNNNELQIVRYGGKSEGVIQKYNNVENQNSLKPGVWHDVEIGNVFTDEGVWAYMTIDGNIIGNYIDTNPNSYDGRLQLMLNSDNGAVMFRPSPDTKKVPPAIPTLKSLGQNQ